MYVYIYISKYPVGSLPSSFMAIILRNFFAIATRATCLAHFVYFYSTVVWFTKTTRSKRARVFIVPVSTHTILQECREYGGKVPRVLTVDTKLV